MCRLFGLHGGRQRVRSCFWLLDAPHSLAVQSRTQPDGYGLGTFEEDGTPDVDRGIVAAYRDAAFAEQARQECSRTYVVHLRYASSGPVAWGRATSAARSTMFRSSRRLPGQE